MGFLSKVRRLPPVDRRLLFRATLLLLATRVGLACIPFRLVRRVLSPTPSQAQHLSTTPACSVERIRWAVHAAGRRVLQDRSCLVQALVAHRLLVIGGHPAQLRIGVAKDAQGGLEAHAWVECREKIVIGEGELSRYTPLSTMAGESR